MDIDVSVNDRTQDLFRNLESLSKLDVLVGIPEEESSREGAGPTNAELAFIHTNGIRRKSMRDEMETNMSKGYSKAYQMYIHEHGSPIWQAPPRPIIEPAIEDDENKAQIVAELNKAAKDVLDGDLSALARDLNLAGMVAQNVIRDWFTNPKNGWAPNSPLTVLNKLRKDGSSISRAIVKHVDEGGSLSDITGLEGMTQPLVDTGELRKAITYVIREKD